MKGACEMATSYERVLQDARSLPPEEQRRLVQELTKSAGRGEEAKVRTLFDAFSEHGLVGFMTDGPTDLSTNPKYMEGFGQDAQ
jgi:hypothetical protein